MEVFRSLQATAGALRGCAVAIGNFDGVHLGHQALFALARQLAGGRGGKAAALTFEPHPVRVLRPDLAPPLLTPLPRKLELLAARGLDAAVVQPFDRDFARSDAEAFVGRDLAGHLGASDVVVGHDFTAGRARTRVDGLRALLAVKGIQLHLVDPVASDGLVVSSTKIRELLLEGHVEGAGQLLGRPHEVEGTVLRGAGRGRGFGFATANLQPEAMLPAHGVYAARAWRLGPAGASGPGAARVYGAVCNVGVKPTVEDAGPVQLEAHLFEHDGADLHGERVRIAFVARLREERRFESLDALRNQIAADAARARTLLGG
jgi:riboflavin kinase / FMN adenylyltransferase